MHEISIAKRTGLGISPPMAREVFAVLFLCMTASVLLISILQEKYFVNFLVEPNVGPDTVRKSTDRYLQLQDHAAWWKHKK